MTTISCIQCGKLCKLTGFSAHYRLSHTSYGKIFAEKAKNGRIGKSPWNKGLTAKNDIRIQQSREKISKGYISHPQSEETKKKISERMKVVGGGYRKGSGIGKSGWYQDVWCDSSWELAFVLWCKIHNKTIVRNILPYKYELNGKHRKYYPDFIVDGKLFEVKGRRVMDDVISAKMAACPAVVLLLEAEMKPILAEIIEKFGSDFIKMYGRVDPMAGKRP